MENNQQQPTSEKHREEKQSVPSLNKETDIAIIGMACRFPGAENYEEFWENIKQGRSSIEEIPQERWDWKAYWGDPQNENNKTNCKWGGFIKGVDTFDPDFFGLSPREVESMDPQQRIMLELSWSCFEDAGIYPSRVSGKKIGVYIGVFNFDYKELQEKEFRTIETYHSTGTAAAVISNRISHYFNLKGPSFSIDTACSSSLHAIHLAIQSLNSGECSMALVGGINLLLTPTRHISFSKTGMLSSTGSCKTFDENADGYVRSEGAGLILLKPLKNALEDGDSIYGVLKGGAVNHNGKTHTLTYPNSEAQAEVISDAYESAGISPESISYIEAHGTGTPKGDPMEFQGLLRAFQYLTSHEGQESRQNYCGLGSVKPNIGHLESAAGIAGVIKVLLSMKYKQLPGLHNFKQLNHRISIKDSPFYIVDQLQEWKPLKDENNQALPRRAGVSSFGFGGTNAHVLLEEPPIITRAVNKKFPYYLICISAKTEKALQQKEQDLALWLGKDDRQNNIANISASLLLGREHFEIRAVYVVRDVQELQKIIKQVLEKGEADGYFRENDSKKGKPLQPRFKELGQSILKELNSGMEISAQEYGSKLMFLAELYAKGYELDYKAIFVDNMISRISLPTYPFARERYWIPEIDTKASNITTNSDITVSIHPLLHQNTSDLSEQRFSSTFTGQEFFLADHVVKGQRVLPGVAYLEMARTAVKLAAGALKEDLIGIRLKNVVWARPIVLGDHPVRVHIGLFPEDNGEIAYEIYSESEAANAEPVVHSQGSAVLSVASQALTLDLKALQAECTQSTLSSTQCYETFKAMGIDYGPGHQGIEKVYVGSGQVLAKLSLPSSVLDTQDQFVLHPSLMDSALQASIGLIIGTGDFKPVLPFSLEELVILGSCTPAMWALIRYSDGSKAGDKVQKLDIDLCDEQGTICMQMKGFSARVLEGEIQTASEPKAVSSETSSEPLLGTIVLNPIWDPIPVEKGKIFPSPSEQVVIVGGTKESRGAIGHHYPKAHIVEIQSEDTIDEIVKKLEAHSFIDHILWIAPHHSLESLAEDSVIEEQNQGVLQVFRIIKALLRLGYGSKDLGWSVFTIQAQPIHKKDVVNPTHASLYGLVGSMAKEYTNWKIRIVDLEAGCDWPLADIFTLPADPQGNGWVYRGQEWYRQKLVPVHHTQLEPTMYKLGGVYVVIGGAGGIGEVWSDYMIRTYQAQIIWIGRRQKDAVIQAKLDKLETIGAAPHYIAADATDQKALYQAYEEIKERYAQIHGVIHSAIVLLDQSLANMEEERFQAALSAKVDVSVRIAQVFHKEVLDFVMFFSSMNSFIKPAGQSNYTSGCIFKDAFAHRLSQEWPCAVKVMNWGYWGSVGIVASKAYQERMAQAGLGSIEPQEAMEALETLLVGQMNQIVLVKTTKPLAMEGMNLEDWITVYPENLSSIVQNIQSQISKQDSQIKPRFSEGGLQIQKMDDLLSKLLWGQLQSIGFFTEKNPVIVDLKTKTGLRDLYDRWLGESIAILAQKNYLGYDGTSCSVVDTTPIDIDAVWKEWDQQKSICLEDPNLKAQVVLVEATLRALPEILTGKQLATEVLFPNSSMELVEGIYKNNLISDYYNEVLANTVVAYLKEQLHQDPSARIRILEIGAGTGGTSMMVFQKLKPYQDQIQEYCYTDISRAFLMHAEKEYGSENPYLTYQIFNAEAPIAGQSISAGGYDLVIAANVLHATKNIRQTLRNVKAALKNKGLILLNELSSNSLFTHLTFGLLEGWWLYEDQGLRIPGCPGISPQTWQAVLESEGFQSVFYPAQEAHELGQQIIVAESNGVIRQKQPLKPSGTPAEKGIITKADQSRIGNKTLQQSVAQNKYLALQKTKTIHKDVDVSDQMVEDHVRSIIRENIAESLKMEEERIQDDRIFSEYGVDSIIAVKLVNLISKQCSISLPTTVLFDYNTVDQLTRHIIQEHKSTLIPLLQENLPIYKGTSIEFSKEAIHVAQKKQSSSYPTINRGRSRSRFQVQDVKSYQEPIIMENHSIYHRVVIERPGGIDDLRVIESRVPELRENEVRISVRAFSLNFGDLLCVRGLYPTMPPYPFTPGFEASGIVVNVGHAVTSIQQGDAVIVTTGKALGGQASMITCSAEQVFPKPKTLSFEEACALPVVAITMLDAFRKARLKRGERILIQTAAGGIGLIAVQLAQYYGAEIYATAGSQHKLDYLKKLGVPYVINYQEYDFEMEIKRLTHGKGVDVIINTLSGDAIQKGLNCLSAGGRYIEVAMTALKSAKTIDLSILSNNQTFFSVDLRKLGFENPGIFKAFQKEMIKSVEQGIIHPTIYRVIPFAQIAEAYQCLENRENIGKIVVHIPKEYQFRDRALVVSASGKKNGFMRSASVQEDSIAIIGMSGRFAKSKSVNELWKHLSNGTDLVEEVSRWDLSEQYSNSAQEEKNYCKHGSFLDDIDQFDPLFFNISGLEATYMDPQQRIFLEESWKALEDAGYAGTGVQGRQCGVYVGNSGTDYQQLFGDNPPAQAFWGNAGSVIPARIAYYLDLQGPAVAIDTACSSSLVAIHLACQGLRAGETELGLAGGIFLQCTPEFYSIANRAGMLSPTGRCHTFDQRADGFVPGEGVGVVVLKRLQEAIADGDHIYGVIRGSGINQDGKTNGITAPSANSQERLERYVYDTFHIHPEQIQMVEAHGTGTKLGDPIEYQALTRAFRNYTDKKEYCAIGSIKTNLGHAATASGVAGVIKILLSLQHKQIPPSLHYQSGNSNIQFEDGPFYVNASLKNWDIEPNSKRCAVVSSFGFSGTNAHMAIEEAPKVERQHSEKPGYLIVLSARAYEQLRQQVEQLVEYCEREHQVDCGNMSYTLILGRKHCNHRLACVVRSEQELVTLLKKWLEKGKVLQVYVSELNINDHREQPSLKHYGNQCIQDCQTTNLVSDYLEQLSTVADLYVQGYELAFEQLFSNDQYSRISLPTYPFARERYWVPESKTAKIPTKPSILHPLLHENTSDLSEQRFSSTFTGQEFFLTDHVVKGQRVLPGVAYLEMAQAAVDLAARALEEGQTGIRLKNVVWVRPVVVGDQPVQVHIGLYPEDNGEIAYKIYSEPEEVDAEPVIHSQGIAILSVASEAPTMDLKVLQAQCTQSTLSSIQCYETFKGMGIDYGPGHQGIEKVYVGSDQVLAKLSLPSSVTDTQDQFALHPSLMDSALQASIGLMMDTGYLKPWLPFSLQELETHGNCSSAMWALIRYSDGSKAGDKVQKLDIDLCDEQGTLCVRMMGLVLRVLEGELKSHPVSKADPSQISSASLVENTINEQSSKPVVTKTTGITNNLLREKSTAYFKKLISETLRIPSYKISSSDQFEKYGIDSILVVQLANAMSKILINISSTLFFEYQTIDALVEYFLKTQKDSLAKLVGLENQEFNEEISSDGKISVETSPVRPKQDSKSRRFLLNHPIEHSMFKEVAIIGLSGRYPQARNVEEFWRNLRRGGHCITEIPKDRWDWKEYFNEEKGKSDSQYTKWGGFIEDIDKFDPLFFSISPAEAEKMDPQERLFLEAAYASIEDSGYTPANICDSRKIGVFVGVMNGYYPTGSSYWSIANRISYLLNFQGPSLAVDTACSSSLTAIHLALESLYSGTSDCAIAGGVNLIVNPAHYLKLSAATMLSSGDSCKSFGDQADGFVDGEGVGAIVLKPLSKAIAGGDHIYGIIKGSMLNAGGKTNGYSVPNPNAQFQLIADALQRARVHARTISYLEAHGTGTILGDPIEIAGLTRAFEQETKDKQFCVIGSVKSNIGHCESASGIAGLTKVLMQLKYRQLVPSLHSKTLNPNIDFTSTPFIVQQKLTEWNRPVVEINRENREYPRIAGVSSFGAGGANAHIVIEEYIPKDLERPLISINPQNPAIIVLSAKNEERLREQVQQLLTAIREQQLSNDNLVDIAYTLQVGREAMDKRLAIIVGSIEELEEKLRSFVEGRDGIEDLYCGQVKQNTEMLAIFTDDKEFQEVIDKWIQNKKFTKLIDLWVKGLTFDWDKLYGPNKPRRLSLPTYPFARERYWAIENNSKSKGSMIATYQLATSTHPLLQQNTSDLSEQRFTSTFTGQEFFLADHVVQGERILPGVAYLEMARAAVDQAAGALEEGKLGIRLKNVVWIRPIAVKDQPVQVHIGLFPEDDGEIAYEIYSKSEAGEADPVVHSQGSAVLGESSKAPTLDIQVLQAQCSCSTLSFTQCYKAFKAAGIEYGPGYQGIEKVYVGSGQVLAKLSLPLAVFDTREQFVLNPSLMDSALQASIGLSMGLMKGTADKTSFDSVPPIKPALLFALQELEIFGSCTPAMWALIRYSDGSEVGDKVEKFNIDLCDDQGTICVRMKGVSYRVLGAETQTGILSKTISSGNSSEPLVRTLMLNPVWDSIVVEKGQAFLTPSDAVTVVGGTNDQRSAIERLYPRARILEIQSQDTIDDIADKLEDHGSIDHIIWIAPQQQHSLAPLVGEEIIAEQSQGVIQVFRMVKSLLRLGYGSRDLEWSIFTFQAQPVHKNETINPTHASVHGLIGSMAKEYPNWKVRLVDLKADCDWPLEDIFTLPADPQGNAWAYRGREWYRQKLVTVQWSQVDRTMYKPGGVYVVIGGAGRIGEAWSEYMIRTYQARIIWIGRRPKDTIIQAKLDKLGNLGPAPYYIAADATDQESLYQAYIEIKARYAQIHGLIHSSVVTLGRNLMSMDEEGFKTTLAAKVDVSVRMAQVFGKESLDFVIFFSSIIAFTKVAGQSNYASGCTFEDAYAHQLSKEWPCKVKVLNWGYWGSVGGIAASQDFRSLMEEKGIGFFDPSEAMAALEIVLAEPMDQIAFLKTTKSSGLEGMKLAEELITVYPQSPLIIIKNLQIDVPQQAMQIRRVISERGACK